MCTIVNSEKKALSYFHHAQEACIGRIKYEIGSSISWVGISENDAFRHIPLEGKKTRELTFPMIAFEEGDIFFYKEKFYEVKKNRLGFYIDPLKPNMLVNAAQASMFARAHGYDVLPDGFSILELNFSIITWYGEMDEGSCIYPMFAQDHDIVLGIDMYNSDWVMINEGKTFKTHQERFLVKDGTYGFFVEKAAHPLMRIV